MAEVIVTFFLFFAVTAVTALLFGGWVIISICRLVWRGISTMTGLPDHARLINTSASAMRACSNTRCKGMNPVSARFCRRCGQHLPEAQHVAVRRAAMW